MCELECGCNYKPLQLIIRRNNLGYSKPCSINPDVCGHFREIRRERRQRAAYSEGQMNLSLRYVYKGFSNLV